MNFKYSYQDPLDSVERTIAHRNIILRKKYLRKLYEQWYKEFSIERKDLPNKTCIELGSGGGFLKEIEPTVICTDILDLPSNDMTFSALDIPFDDESIGIIFMIDTLHHIPDIERFLSEADRVLVKGGKLIMIEPGNSIWGRFIYKNFHHEPFDPKGGWTIPQKGPLSGANGALPWIVFERDYKKFRNQFPNLHLVDIEYRNPFLYLLSGGVSYRQILPDFAYPLVNGLEK